MMTLKEFRADYQRETGAVMSNAAWKVLYSQYRESEYEAIAGGRDDVSSDPMPRPRHSDTCWYAMERGSECLCGLIPWDESYHGGEMTVADAQEELASIAREWFPSAFDDVPF